MTEGEMIAIAVAAVPDYYKERAFRYMRKILPSLLPKPRYTELLKAQAEQRLLSVNESRSLNVYKVCQRAGEILGEVDFNTPTVTDNLYEDDWLSTFENESCHKSSEDMQERFARMLAGEIKSPGTFSIRAIKLLGQIDSGTASIFRYFCSGCVSFDSPSGSGLIYNSVFPTLGGESSIYLIGKYEINNKMLSRLQEFSLLESEVRASFAGDPVLDLQECLIGNSEDPPSPFLYAGKYYLIKRHDDKKDVDWDFSLPGFFLSSLGDELACIIEPEPIQKLSEDLKEFFKNKQLELVEVKLTDDKHWKPKL